MQMGSRTRFNQERHLNIPDDARESAVLMLLYPMDGELHLPLILRNVYPGVHSGQIGLPGGRVEEFDTELVDTALRETEEEVGVPRAEIQVLGRLSQLYIPPSNFLVHPFIGYSTSRPNFVPDHTEVQQVIETRLNDFLDEKNIDETVVEVGGGMKMKVPRFLINGHTVWGATAMMMAEFAAIMREIEQ